MPCWFNLQCIRCTFSLKEVVLLHLLEIEYIDKTESKIKSFFKIFVSYAHFLPLITLSRDISKDPIPQMFIGQETFLWGIFSLFPCTDVFYSTPFNWLAKVTVFPTRLKWLKLFLLYCLAVRSIISNQFKYSTNKKIYVSPHSA